MAEKRSAATAAVGNILVPGLGFIYLGRLLPALGLLLILVGVNAVSAWSRLIFAPIGMLAVTALMLLIWLASIATAAVMARRQTNAPRSGIQRWYVYLAYAAVVLLALDALRAQREQVFGYGAFRQPSSSMENGLLVGDFMLVDTWAFERRPPARGDVVVFHYPANPSELWVKRIVGLPGERVDVARDGSVRIDGTPWQLAHARLGTPPTVPAAPTSVAVPERAYFVLGDHRGNSIDSRHFGPVPADHLHGRVETIWMSWHARGGGLRTDRIGMRVE